MMNYIYKPQEDITAYELATIFGRFANGKNISGALDGLPPGARRHFKNFTEPMLQKFEEENQTKGETLQASTYSRMTLLWRFLRRMFLR